MKTLLICHEEALLDREGLARWLASFSELCGLIVLQEGPGKLLLRSKREIRRIGLIRFLDVVLFRFYYKFFLAQTDARKERDLLVQLKNAYPPLPTDLPVLYSRSPNSPEAEQFLRALQPDVAIARCKILLQKRIFTIPTIGTFVMHPGICPEYRNAHGCFWALAQGDVNRVGMTLLKIDEGVDTGPVYGFYHCRFDETADSHIVIQARSVFDNLNALREKFQDIASGKAQSINVTGRHSAVWGQPWLSKYLAWKRAARTRKSIA